MFEGINIHNGEIFLEPLGNKNVFKGMKKGASLLEQLNLKYWFSSGTVLGLVREEKGWITHDSDIDVEILITKPFEFDKLIRLYETEGYKLIRIVDYKGAPMQIAFEGAERIIFDIMIYYNTGDKNNYINFNDKGILKIPKEMVQTTETIKGFIVPHPVKEYLNLRFGSDWMIPRTEKVSWEHDAGKLLTII